MPKYGNERKLRFQAHKIIYLRPAQFKGGLKMETRGKTGAFRRDRQVAGSDYSRIPIAPDRLWFSSAARRRWKTGRYQRGTRSLGAQSRVNRKKTQAPIWA